MAWKLLCSHNSQIGDSLTCEEDMRTGTGKGRICGGMPYVIANICKLFFAAGNSRTKVFNHTRYTQNDANMRLAEYYARITI